MPPEDLTMGLTLDVVTGTVTGGAIGHAGQSVTPLAHLPEGQKVPR